MSNIDLRLNNVPIKVKSANLDQNIGKRSTLTFTWEKPTFTPIIGYRVECYVEGDLIFRGKVSQLDYGGINDLMKQLEYTVTAVDLSEVADRRLVVGRFNSTDDKTWNAGGIARFIVENYFLADGITIGTILDGHDIERRVYNYRKASDALTELAEENGYLWWITETGVFHFADRTSLTAPFNLWTGNRAYRNVRVSETNEELRTVQYVRGGSGGLDRTETFTGKADAGYGRRELTLHYPIANTADDLPEIMLRNTVIEDAEQRYDWYQLRATCYPDTSGDWYFETGQNWLRGGELITNHKIYIEYKALIPVLTVAQDEEATNERISAEGGSGLYEDIYIDESLEDNGIANQRADALLRRFSRPIKTVTYETWVPGLRPGAIQQMWHPELGLAGDFIIESVTGAGGLETKRLHQFLYSVTARQGREAMGDWLDYFRRMMPNHTPRSGQEGDENLVMLRRKTVSLDSDVVVTWAIAGSGNRATVGSAVVGSAVVGT